MREVFVILCTGDVVRRVLILAYSLGMGNGEFVFINVNLIESQSELNGLRWFKQNDRMNRVAKQMYQSLLVIGVRVPTSVEYRNFVALLIKYTKDNYNSIIYEYDPVATFLGTKQEFDYIPGVEIHWPGNRNGPPLDIPDCGFQGDAPHCQEPDAFPPYATAGIALAGFIVIAGISAFFIIKKLQYESQLNDQWWKITWDDITLPGKSLSKSRVSLPSHNDSSLASQPGIRVAIKPLNVKKIHVNRQLLAEIKLIHDLTHENLVRFVGLCLEDPNVSIITELCTRGSLRDMLENEEINIDWMFKCSMITDIVEGLHYLHGTAIQYHGRLKSTKCIVDGRFVVKLSDYGLRHLHAQLPEPEDKNPRSMFWTAPEFLRLKEPRQHSSQKGDIYAFAIILQEVITRSGPYESLERIGRTRSVMEPEEILDRVKMGTTPPFRPEVSPDECPADMLRLMRACWAENPSDRPTIAEVRHAVKKITKGLSSKNFFDNLLQRMEQYANNLESLVEEKTQSLLEEKKRTDELLYQLLPRYVADELKKGSHVQPEAFESVTIFFSDIVGFTSLSADSSPMQVVTLLNDLYTCFDSIIDRHDAYKVETIGDAYLVASGLPIRNGNEHVREIARIALTLRHQLQFFKIRHLPKRKLQLRIGVHSGPCVAGVVGLKMPKYCLFGDTVNTASRMETTGEPLKIHVSSKAKELLDIFGNFQLTLRGEVQVKGKGVMTTYWLEGEHNWQPETEQ
ncbi:atrial natriuretic peptide receptor 1 [Dermacentor silvarum]|uniref:atrial natriuretic peptide receptor 1 n=1 Tax=Dermacentor silvarum TaxID=543639 RepID=UPI002101A446|nr:atrial natriuretic peptide receptor 1 [Dermacentor silvarum]